MRQQHEVLLIPHHSAFYHSNYIPTPKQAWYGFIGLVEKWTLIVFMALVIAYQEGYYLTYLMWFLHTLIYKHS